MSGNGQAPVEREATEEEKQKVKDILELMKRQNISAGMNTNTTTNTNPNTNPTTSLVPHMGKKHAFWDTQPTLNSNSNSTTDSAPEMHKPLIPNKPTSELRQTPYNMPKGFEWADIDITDLDQQNQVYDLLNRNYVEDDDCMFRFDYSHQFLEWALTPPHFQTSFHLGVRSVSTQKLVAFISAVPATIRAYEESFPSVEINFLCVHKKLRSKRLAPVLIKEITRRVNHSGVFQAVYTAGIVLPGPVSSCRYWHRTLNAKKLVDIGFTVVPRRETMARMIKKYKLPSKTVTEGLVPMTPSHVPEACALLKTHLDHYPLAVEFSEDDFAHWLLPRDGVISSYVVVSPSTGKVTDLISFYHLHSSIIGNPNHTHLYAAYSFYNVATSVDIEELMRDALILAKNEGMDVFNALDQMKNSEFFEGLKFGAGDGNLQYYLYNWCCPTMESKDVGIVLL